VVRVAEDELEGSAHTSSALFPPSLNWETATPLPVHPQCRHLASILFYADLTNQGPFFAIPEDTPLFTTS
jgi:hypothetical protein